MIRKLCVLTLSFMLLFVVCVKLDKIDAFGSYSVHNLNTGVNYATIQAAIDANETLDGHTIFVDEGIYNENVVVNKSLSLIGENRERTIINGNQSTQDNFVFFISRTCGVVVESFTIQNCKAGVFLLNSNYSRISNNRIINCTWEGVWVYGSRDNFIDRNLFNTSYVGVFSCGEWERSSGNNVIFANTFDKNTEAAIAITESANDSVLLNSISQNQIGIDLRYAAYNNSIIANTFQGNVISASFYESHNNTFYHNNFINNSGNVQNSPSDSIWDSSYPSGGNYWSDYNGIDLYSGPYQNETGPDTIGDTPYINPEYRDNYPLMTPYLVSQNMPIEVWNLYYQIFEKGIDLETEYRALLFNYDILQTNYRDLQEASNNLTATYTATSNELNRIRILMYAFMVSTIILLATTIYLVTRKPKGETKSKTIDHSQ